METLNAELFKIEYPNRAIVRDKSFANDAGYRIDEKTDDYWMNNMIGDAGRSTSWIVYLRFENNVTFEDHDLVDLLVDDLLIAGKTITFFENWYHVTFDPTDDPENEGELLSAFRFIKVIRDAVHPISVEKAGVVQKKHIRLQGNAKLKNDDIEGLTEKLSIIEAKADSPVSSSLGSIKPTDAAPTPARNGNYTFSIGGAKPAWLTAEAGITEVKAGDGVVVVFTAPNAYSYTHVDISKDLLRISEFNTYNNESSMFLQLDKLLGKFSEREVVSSNPNTFVDKYTGNIINLNGYYTKKYDISENKRYYCSTKINGLQSTMAAYYDVDMVWLGNQNASAQSNVLYSFEKELIKKPFNTKYIIITSRIADYAEPFLFEVNSYAEADQRFLSSVLYNKKIACVGDSITHGSTASAIAIGDEFMPASGPQFKNFMYNIAKRNGLKWYNYGISGTTLGDCFAEGSDKSGFAKAGGRYTTMNAELDYILLMFGTNDNAYGQRMWTELYIQNKYGAYYKFPRTLDLIGQVGYFTQVMYDDALAQTGTINGVTYSNSNAWAWDLAQYIGTINDSTNKTWYGAWNIVLPYLINKYPLSKILIWLNPTSTTFSDSTKLICKKWGIPYLDLHEDNRPLIWYKPNLSGYGAMVNGVSVTTFRKNTLTVDGLHPNDAGYEYLSTIIESELLKI